LGKILGSFENVAPGL